MMTSMVLWLKGVNGFVAKGRQLFCGYKGVNAFVAKGREWPCAGDQLLAGGLLVLLNPSLLPIVCVACVCKVLLFHVVQHRYESPVFPLQGMPRLFFTLDQKLCLT